MADVQILYWNVHSMNTPIKRSAVRDMVTTRVTVTCIQEMKIQLFDDRLVATTMPRQVRARRQGPARTRWWRGTGRRLLATTMDWIG
jgi:hypothetical protein